MLDVPDSKTFDVTLMITLLRNLTNFTPPRGGYDCLPTTTETTSTSDLARIKYYRNFLAHLGEGKIDNTIFITAWDDITGVSNIKRYRVDYQKYHSTLTVFEFLSILTCCYVNTPGQPLLCYISI